MTARTLVFALAAMLAASSSARAACSLGLLGELKVTMVNNQPLVPVKINDKDVVLMADSGAFFSMVSEATAKRLGLTRGALPFGARVEVRGFGGGSEAVDVLSAKTFEFAGLHTANVEFIVGGGEVGAAAGILGQNVFRLGDVEYDLANGAIRLFRPKDCPPEATMAYWVKPHQDFSVVPVEPTSPERPHTRGYVSVNGAKVFAWFDTGAAASVLDLQAARRAGLTPDMPGAVAIGRSHGVGRELVRTWSVPVASFKVGDEEIRNTRIQIADIGMSETDMLIGADFFLAHRVYLAKAQRQLYLTYNGGPVFSLKASSPPAGAVPPETTAASGPGPEDADLLARRGDAVLSRRDVASALKMLDEAIRLDPQNPRFRYDRARARLTAGEIAAAVEDLDAALALKPDDPQALTLRAEAHFALKRRAEALADLELADHAADRSDNVRLDLGRLYIAGGRLPDGVRQLDLWVAAHPDDAQAPLARGLRCRAKAFLGIDLDRATADCDAALRALDGRDVSALASRGLILLRRGLNARALKDFSAALALNPTAPWALYGKGLALKRLGQEEAGTAALEGVLAAHPDLLGRAEAFGLGEGSPAPTGAGPPASGEAP